MSASPTTEMLVASGRRLRIDSRRRWFPDLGEFASYFHLVVLLGRRDITAKYRQTVLGTVWIFGGPVVTAVLFAFVFGRVADLPSGGFPYFVFSYAGLLGWNLFSSTLGNVASSINTNSSLVTKIYFPRLVLPLSAVASTLVNLAISFCIMLVFLLAFDIGFSTQLVLLPFWLLLAFLLAMGIGLVLTAFAVTYRDVNYVTPVFTSLLLYLSPVAYSVEAVPENLQSLYLLNPLTTIIEGCRWSLLGSGSLTAWAIVYTVVVTIVSFIVGLVVFTRRQQGFADVI